MYSWRMKTLHTRRVTLHETQGMQVRVDGLAEGDLLILEGAHRLTDGDRLAVSQEEAAP